MSRKTTPKEKQQLVAETGFGTLDHSLLGNDPNEPRPSNSPAFDPEGRVAEQERRAALLDSTVDTTLQTFDLGSEAKVTQIATAPDAWIVESNGEAFTYVGNVHQFLAERGVTVVED